MAKRRQNPNATRQPPTVVTKKLDYCLFIPIDAYVEGYGWRVAIVRRGEDGYHLTGGNDWPVNPASVKPWFYGHDYKQAREVADEHNRRMGLSPQDVAEIIMSSIRAQNVAELPED